MDWIFLIVATLIVVPWVIILYPLIADSLRDTSEEDLDEDLSDLYADIQHVEDLEFLVGQAHSEISGFDRYIANLERTCSEVELELLAEARARAIALADEIAKR